MKINNSQLLEISTNSEISTFASEPNSWINISSSRYHRGEYAVTIRTSWTVGIAYLNK